MKKANTAPAKRASLKKKVTTSKKTTVADIDLKAGKHPFPFWGAGDASYFEWGEVIVRFKMKPTRAQVNAIKDCAPPPITPEKRDFRGSMLMAGSDQFLHIAIADSYYDDNDDNAGWADGRFFFASTAGVNKFNADIERWLLEIHAICPVEAAYRREDGESGGTELSKWHTESLKQTHAWLQMLVADTRTFTQKKEEQGLFEYMLRGVMAFSGIEKETLPVKLRKFVKRQ
jgi:hypothetical protein